MLIAILFLVFFVLLVSGFLCVIREDKGEEKEKDLNPTIALAQLVITAIEGCDGWVKGQYIWHNEDLRIAIWVANKDYGLGVKVGDFYRSPKGLSANIIGPCDNPDRIPKKWMKKIWMAVEKHSSNGLLAQHQTVADLATRILEKQKA